jgi:hypothetical protein
MAAKYGQKIISMERELLSVLVFLPLFNQSKLNKVKQTYSK